MQRKIFLRQGYWRYSKLGLRRKKKLVYRKAKGRDNKVRLQEKGRLVKVKIGFKKSNKERGFVKGAKPVIVRSIEDLKKIKKNEIAIIGKLGMKKKLALVKYADENNLRLSNVNPKKFIKKVEEKLKMRKEKRQGRKKKKQVKEKKAKEPAEKKDQETKKEETLENKTENKNEEEVKNEPS